MQLTSHKDISYILYFCKHETEYTRSLSDQTIQMVHIGYAYHRALFRKDCHLFHIGDHGTINKHIKRVAAMCGIKKQVSFHVSRHSWAVLALEYGMPIESVSKILGHTNITTTQIYAKVTSNKLDHDISVFESRIKGHLPVIGGMV